MTRIRVLRTCDPPTEFTSTSTPDFLCSSVASSFPLLRYPLLWESTPTARETDLYLLPWETRGVVSDVADFSPTLGTPELLDLPTIDLLATSDVIPLL